MGLLNFLNKSKGKRVIIGLDGIPYPMIRQFRQDGTMPAFGSIVQDAAFVPMQSSRPHVSSVAWSSMITGCNPGEHGIFGFMELKPGTYDFHFPNSGDLKVKPFWHDEPDRKSIIINVPSTYPAQELNGTLIAGFVAIDLAKATYPRELVPTLKEFDYRCDTDASKGHESLDEFLIDVNDTLTARIKTYRHLWHTEKWDTFMLVITGTDRLCHFLYEAYEQSNHNYRQQFIDYFKRVDELIREIYSQVTDNDLFMMMSDHGFGHMDTEVYLNRYLIEQGLLTLRENPPSSFNAIGPGTKAFVLDPSRIYVHTTDRYPRGEVQPEDKPAVLEELTRTFSELTIDGRPVIKEILTPEMIFSGPSADRAPDLVLVEHDGFDLKAKLGAQELYGRTVFSGKHTPDDAFLLVRTPQGIHAEIPEAVSVYDFRQIMEECTRQ